MELRAPRTSRDRKRMLQEAVYSLLDNGRRGNRMPAPQASAESLAEMSKWKGALPSELAGHARRLLGPFGLLWSHS